jgi:hypothetical protein
VRRFDDEIFVFVAVRVPDLAQMRLAPLIQRQRFVNYDAANVN